MGNIDVTLLHSRFRLPRGAAARNWLARIDAIQSDLVDTHLEPALAPFAMTDEVICVRRVALPLRLSGAVTDWQLSLQWSALIADELQRILSRDAPDKVLRFPHELAARQAFLADALGGRSERDWAWKQLGWLPASTATSGRERIDAAVAASIAAADGVVPLLRGLAGAGLLPLLARALDKRQRDRLLIAALAVVPDAADLLARWVVDAESAEEILPERPTAVTAAALSAPFLALLRETANAGERREWAVLAVLCCEPHRLRAVPDEAAAVAQVWLRQTTAPSLIPLKPKPDAPAEPPKHSAIAPEPDEAAAFAQVWLRQTIAPSLIPLKPKPDAPAEPPKHSAIAPEPDGASRGLTPPAGAPASQMPRLRRPSGTSEETAASADREEPKEFPLASRGPVEGETAFGGLLFLLPLVAETGALDQMLAEPALAEWPLPAVLHRLALTLLPPLRATDPAALAFAGLPPDAAPPDATQPDGWRRDPGASAAVALGAAAARVVDELSARLPQWAGPALVQRVAERWAVIAADPGWIEVGLRLADVSVELRRAALDLDPGFLPWLGILLRYRYA